MGGELIIRCKGTSTVNKKCFYGQNNSQMFYSQNCSLKDAFALKFSKVLRKHKDTAAFFDNHLIYFKLHNINSEIGERFYFIKSTRRSGFMFHKICGYTNCSLIS